jgi:uncharacterized protein YjbI with pentapeptide repeats
MSRGFVLATGRAGPMAATVSDRPNDQALALLHRLVTALEDDAPRPSRFERWGKAAAVFATPVTILLSAVGIVATIFLTSAQLDASSQQFDRTWRQSQYSDIVDGLASSSVGVQVNSIRRLVQYVADKRNFENDDEQEAAAQNAAQTLAAFMTDESQLAGDDGLSNYRDPQPVVVSRAFTQLDDLVDTGLSVALDLSKGNFHGVYEPGLRPNSSFLIRGADFRGATLAQLDLTKVPSPQLQSAFFTCTDLQGAKLGSADVSGADFTGANLGAADLSHVRGLTSAQLSGARVGPVTRLPKGVHAPPQPSWGVEDDANFGPTDACKKLLEAMTHLLAGTGYSDRLPCPAVDGSRWQVRLSSVENDARQRVCSFRDRMDHGGSTDPSAARQRSEPIRGPRD